MSDDFASRMKRRRAGGFGGSGPIRALVYACKCGKPNLPLLGFCSHYCEEIAEVQARQAKDSSHVFHGKVKVVTPLTEGDVNKALRTLKSLEDSLYTGGPITGGFDGLGVLLEDP